MSAAEPARALRVVDAESGEELPGCPSCARLEAEAGVLRDQLKGAERDLNGWRARYQELKRDKEADARRDPRWPEAVRLFRLYCRLTGKPDKPRKLGWDPERFWLVEPFLRKHGLEMCERAIVGRVFDHYTAVRKNGTTVHYHEWERIFKSAKEFEESARRAPRGFTSELAAEDEAEARAEHEAAQQRADERRGQGQLG